MKINKRLALIHARAAMVKAGCNEAVVYKLPGLRGWAWDLQDGTEFRRLEAEHAVAVWLTADVSTSPGVRQTPYDVLSDSLRSLSGFGYGCGGGQRVIRKHILEDE